MAVNPLKTFLLPELVKGLMVTARTLFSRKYTLTIRKRRPAAPRFRGLQRCAVSERPGALHRLQAVRAVCPRCASPIDSMWRPTARGAPRAMTSIFSKCIYCGFCEEACPVDAIVLTRILEYHMERRGENIMSKDKLLAVGDRYEAMIAGRPGGGRALPMEHARQRLRRRRRP